MRLTLFPESEQLSKQLSEAWANFAREGDPGTEELPWPAYNLKRRTTMIFDAQGSGAVKDPHRYARIMLKDLASGSLL